MCVCVCVGGGLQIYYIICSARADKTHTYRLCYGVTETGLVGAAVVVPSFHPYLGDNATDCTMFVCGYSSQHSIITRLNVIYMLLLPPQSMVSN